MTNSTIPAPTAIQKLRDEYVSASLWREKASQALDLAVRACGETADALKDAYAEGDKYLQTNRKFTVTTQVTLTNVNTDVDHTKRFHEGDIFKVWGIELSIDGSKLYKCVYVKVNAKSSTFYSFNLLDWCMDRMTEPA